MAKVSKPLKESKKAPVYSPEGNGVEEEYELMPHKEISELKNELKRLKSMPAAAGRHTEASYEELVKRMDKLVEIFTEAEHQLKVEEGAVSFKEKMAPLNAKMEKILEQNSEIAEGVVALADILTEIKDKVSVGVVYRKEKGDVGAPMPRPAAPMPGAPMPPPQGVPIPPPRGAPMPPPPGGIPPSAGAPMSPPPGGLPPPMPRAPAPGPYPEPPKKKKGLFGK